METYQNIISYREAENESDAYPTSLCFSLRCEFCRIYRGDNYMIFSGTNELEVTEQLIAHIRKEHPAKTKLQ